MTFIAVIDVKYAYSIMLFHCSKYNSFPWGWLKNLYETLVENFDIILYQNRRSPVISYFWIFVKTLEKYKSQNDDVAKIVCTMFIKSYARYFNRRFKVFVLVFVLCMFVSVTKISQVKQHSSKPNEITKPIEISFFCRRTCIFS